MKYHALITYDRGIHCWHNFTKEEIVDEVLLPFVNGHIVLITLEGTRRILNTKSVSRMTIFKTSFGLIDTIENPILEQISSKEFLIYACTEEAVKEAKLLNTYRSSSSLLQKALMEPKEQVFVISKFGDKVLDSAYEGVIKPLFEELGIKVIRVDEIQDSGKIDDQILTLIAESKYVLAELSGSRPNCYYETGFAHALGKQIILVVKKDEQIHFDLAGYRFIQWETEYELRIELRKRLSSITTKNSI